MGCIQTVPETDWGLVRADSAPKFSFDGEFHKCRVIDCYDGDTITVVFWHNRKYQQFKIRMMGYDSPEKRSKNPAEKEAALQAKQYLEELILQKHVFLDCHKFDKYGRLLGTVYLNRFKGESVNQMMMDAGHGYPYLGGTKKEFKE